MTTVKKLTAIVLAFIMAFSVCLMTASAEDATPYIYTDHMSDEFWTAQVNDETKMNAGEFTKYCAAKAYYCIWDKTTYTVDEAKEKGLSVSTSADYDKEAFVIEAFYAFNCPCCGKALGGTSLKNIYNGEVYAFKRDDAENEVIDLGLEGNTGKCWHCGEYLPDPETVDIYRFIIVNVGEDTTEGKAQNYHETVYYKSDLTSSAKDVFGATAGDYAGGKDLCEACLNFTEVAEGTEISVLDSFDVEGKASYNWVALLWTIVLKLQKFLKDFNESPIIAAYGRIKLFLVRYCAPFRILAYPTTMLYNGIMELVDSLGISF